MAARSSRKWAACELAAFGRTLRPGALLLDAGAGDERNSVHFQHCRYESADFQMVDKAYAQNTYVCDLAAIPVESERYDAIVFTQVIEHLPDPDSVIKELFRVLKPSGRLFYSGPLLFHEHEVPFDFRRYTQYGVRSIFEKNGFRVPEVAWLEGYLGAVAYQFQRMAKCLPLAPRAYGGGIIGVLLAVLFTVVRIGSRVLAHAAAYADLRHRWVESGYPLNYFGVFEKPASAGEIA